MNALARARIALVGIALVLAAAIAGRIFDRGQPWLIVPAVTTTATAIVVVNRERIVRSVALVAAAFVGVGAVLVGEGGSLGDTFVALIAGPNRILSTEWPSPDRPDLVATAAWAIAALGGVACELAGRRRWHLTPLVPLLVLVSLLIAAGSGAGTRLWQIVPFALIGAAFAALRPGATWSRRLAALSGERRLFPLLVVAVAIAGLLSVPLSLTARADPRDSPPAVLNATVVDPVEATVALRSLDPPLPMFEVAVLTGPPPARWRTAALDSYDGQRWAPDLTVRPIGSRLQSGVTPDVTAQITILDDTLRLVPLPGTPVTIDVEIEADDERTILMLAEPAEVGQTFDITSEVPLPSTGIDTSRLAPRQVTPEDRALATIAEQLAGAAEESDQLAALQNLEEALRTEYRRAPEVSGAGLQRKLIELFIRDSKEGTDEQFAAAFVLLARALEVDARLATGFIVEPGPSTFTVTSADARVWPEVRITDGRGVSSWIAFDPVPDEIEGAGPTPEPDSESPTPAPAQPDVPRDDAGGEEREPQDAPPPPVENTLTRILGWIVMVAGVAGILVLPLLVVAGVIVAIKWNRRRRLLGTTFPLERIRAEWVIATDALVDAGLRIPAAATDVEIASAALDLVPAAEDELVRLALLARSATFGNPPRAEVLALDANACRNHVLDAIAFSKDRGARIRWRLSLRSLKTSSRSPIRPTG